MATPLLVPEGRSCCVHSRSGKASAPVSRGRCEMASEPPSPDLVPGIVPRGCARFRGRAETPDRQRSYTRKPRSSWHLTPLEWPSGPARGIFRGAPKSRRARVSGSC